MSRHDLQARPVYHYRRDSIVRTGTPLPDDRDLRRRTLLPPQTSCPTTSTTPRTASTGTQVRTNLAQLRLQLMIKLKMPKATSRVILISLVVIVGNTALTEPAWKESSVSTSPGNPAITASGAVDSELKALLNDGGPNSTTSARHNSNSSALVAAAAGADNKQFYQLGELLVRDGLANTIINLSREMNGWWYAWS